MAKPSASWKIALTDGEFMELKRGSQRREVRFSNERESR